MGDSVNPKFVPQWLTKTSTINNNSSGSFTQKQGRSRGSGGGGGVIESLTATATTTAETVLKTGPTTQSLRPNSCNSQYRNIERERLLRQNLSNIKGTVISNKTIGENLEECEKNLEIHSKVPVLTKSLTRSLSEGHGKNCGHQRSYSSITPTREDKNCLLGVLKGGNTSTTSTSLTTTTLTTTHHSRSVSCRDTFDSSEFSSSKKASIKNINNSSKVKDNFENNFPCLTKSNHNDIIMGENTTNACERASSRNSCFSQSSWGPPPKPSSTSSSTIVTELPETLILPMRSSFDAAFQQQQQQQQQLLQQQQQQQSQTTIRMADTLQISTKDVEKNVALAEKQRLEIEQLKKLIPIQNGIKSLNNKNGSKHNSNNVRRTSEHRYGGLSSTNSLTSPIGNINNCVCVSNGCGSSSNGSVGSTNGNNGNANGNGSGSGSSSNSSSSSSSNGGGGGGGGNSGAGAGACGGGGGGNSSSSSVSSSQSGCNLSKRTSGNGEIMIDTSMLTRKTGFLPNSVIRNGSSSFGEGSDCGRSTARTDPGTYTGSSSATCKDINQKKKEREDFYQTLLGNKSSSLKSDTSSVKRISSESSVNGKINTSSTASEYQNNGMGRKTPSSLNESVVEAYMSSGEKYMSKMTNIETNCEVEDVVMGVGEYLVLPPSPEEERFLCSLGWDKDAHVDMLTKEEIEDFKAQSSNKDFHICNKPNKRFFDVSPVGHFSYDFTTRIFTSDISSESDSLEKY